MQGDQNLTEPGNGGSLIPYVCISPVGRAAALSPCPQEPDDSRRGRDRPRRRLRHPLGGTSQRRRGAPGDRVLRPIPRRHRALADCRELRHGPCACRSVQCRPRESSGRIAQLVQSACLTRRMSGVRIPLRPFTAARRARTSMALRGRSSCGGFGMFLFRLVTCRAVQRSRARRRRRRRAFPVAPGRPPPPPPLLDSWSPIRSLSLRPTRPPR